MNKQLKKDGGRGIECPLYIRPFNPTDRQQGWLEAFIDSEGSISLLRERRPHFRGGVTYKARVNIANKCLPMVERAQNLIGGCIVRSRQGVHNLDVSANQIRRFLPHLTLVAKEKQRRLLLKALVIITRKAGRALPRTDRELQKLEAIRIQIRTLNNTIHRWKRHEPQQAT